jgi:hypothetical protein
VAEAQREGVDGVGGRALGGTKGAHQSPSNSVHFTIATLHALYASLLRIEDPLLSLLAYHCGTAASRWRTRWLGGPFLRRP